MNNPQYKTLNACYMYYHAANHTPLSDLVSDCLVHAHNVCDIFSFLFNIYLFILKNNFDVFNALDLMDNKTFLEKLKFGVGDGNLQYYIYNWRCRELDPEKVLFDNF